MTFGEWIEGVKENTYITWQNNARDFMRDQKTDAQDFVRDQKTET